MRIVLIGPVYPYKGGIAHYTSLMYKALSKEHEVELISYKMQYPKFLYKQEQKDFSNDMFKVDEAKFEIHTANPFNIIRVGMEIRKKRPDLVIMQWWHPYFSPCYWILQKAIGNSIKKMFICHNVFPHERFPMDRLLTKVVLKSGDCYVVQSKTDGEDLLSIKQNACYKFNPHPFYSVFKVRDISKKQAREELGVATSEKLILFFGFVKEYKGLKHLLKAMPMVKKQVQSVKLMVVGAFDNDKADYLKIIDECGITDSVEVIDGYTPDNEVEKYFAACDFVALPYESATQSGIVQIAYGFEKPVIVTRVGGLPDVVTDGKTGYVVEPFNPDAIAKAICDIYEGNRLEEFSENVKKEAYKFSWERMVETIETLARIN